MSCNGGPGQDSEIRFGSVSRLGWTWLVYTHQVARLHLRHCLVPSWCGNCRTIWNCMLLIVRGFGPSSGRRSRDSPQRKSAHQNEWMNEWVCRPALNVCIYEIVLSLFAKSKCRIQIIPGRRFAFLWKPVKSIRHTVEGKMVLTP